MRFDVFVSHNSKDADVAGQLSTRLEDKAGLVPYFSPEEIHGGDAWLRELHEAIESSRAMLVLVGRYGIGRWQEEEVAAALNRHKRETSYRVIPVLLPGSETESLSALSPFLANRHAIDFRAGIDDADALEALLRGIRSDAEPRQTRRRRLWYYDDNPERLHMFERQHASEFAITPLTNPMDVLDAASATRPGDRDWPDAVLVDMYAPNESTGGAAARVDADRMLLDFMRMERELKGWVDAAWRPYGADVVSIVRRTYSADELPIAIFTQRGLVLLDDKIVSDLEWLGVQWVIKDRFSAETERLMLNNIIAEGKNRGRRGRPRILYLEDGERFQRQFRERHGQHYDVEIISDQSQVIPALEAQKGSQMWPDLLLVDLYYPNDTSEQGRPAIEVANAKLKEFHDFENEFRTVVKQAFEPLGLMIVEQLRKMYDPAQLPIIIYTQTGLLLLEEESIRRLEEYGTGWLLKDRYHRRTEAVKILAHILRSKKLTGSRPDTG